MRERREKEREGGKGSRKERLRESGGGEQNDMQGKGPTHCSVTWGGSRSTLTLRWQGTHTHYTQYYYHTMMHSL